MSKIVECVPNFSEGRDRKIIDAIADAMRAVPGVTLLDVDPGASTNRTVYTLVGAPEDAIEGALAGAKVAYQLIDMTKHKGEHKRLGAMDVCPFIPVQGVTMEDCVYCARVLAERLAAMLNVPVYLYGFAAHQEYRKTVPQIRAGEYEAIKDRILEPQWKPDFGPAEFVPRWGATMAGARKFLIAYNVNMLSTKEQAHRIALDIRENGRNKGEPGKFKGVQAMGWWLEEDNMAQVTINILDYEITPIHEVYEAVLEGAVELNLPVTGSQVVGLVPLNSILAAADYYIKKENLFIYDEGQKVHLAINRLGLNSSGQFVPKERIIEYMLPNDKLGPLIKLSVSDFVGSVGARTTAPGGGSVAAMVGALGASLGSMVAKLSHGKRIFEQNEEPMRRLIPIFHEAMEDILNFVDADTDAFTDYVNARRLPKATPIEQAVREAAMEAGIKNAISVPLNLAKAIDKLWQPAQELAPLINIASASDLEVGVNCLKIGLLSAYYNVKINLKDTTDEKYKLQIDEEVERLREQSNHQCQAVLDILEKRKQPTELGPQNDLK